jgi:outer membrane protein TolC
MRPIFICCVALALAAPARADTLWQAWQLARANDPAFAAAGAQLRAAATAEPAALAALLPQFTLGASAGPQNQHLAAPEFYGSGFEPVTQTQKLGVSTWQATITQPLFDWTALKTYQAPPPMSPTPRRQRILSRSGRLSAASPSSIRTPRRAIAPG